MVQFRIEAKELVDYLSSIFLNGLVFDCVIAVDKSRLVATGLDIAKAVYFRVIKEVAVQESGELIIGNIGLFMKVLSRFDGMIEITSTEKEIKVRRKNKIGRFEVADKKSIDSYTKTSEIHIGKDFVKTPTVKLTYKTNSFLVDAEELASIVGDADILDEHIYAIEMNKDHSVVFRVTKGRNSFSTKLLPSKAHISIPLGLVFGHGIKEVFSTVKGDVRIHLEPKPPLMLRFGKKFESLYLVMTREEKVEKQVKKKKSKEE